MKALRFILFLLAAALCSCPCVTDIDGKKITEPEKYAAIAVINCISQSGTVKISDKYEDTLAFANYVNISNGTAKAAAEIENFLKITVNASGTVLYYSPVVLRDREKLTFIPYGDTLHTFAFLLNDSIPSYSPNNVYIRLVNVFSDTNAYYFSATGGYPLNHKLGYGVYSQILTSYSAATAIEIKNESGQIVCSLDDLKLSAGKLYVIVLRSQYKNSAAPECVAVELSPGK